jgi:predicted Zn-dependent protease
MEENYSVIRSEILIYRKLEKFCLHDSKEIRKTEVKLRKNDSGFPWQYLERETTSQKEFPSAEGLLNRLVSRVPSGQKLKELSLDEKIPVILQGAAAIEVIKQISNWFLAEKVIHHQSPFQLEDLGQPKLSPALTLIDDGENTNLPFQYAFDVEGVMKTKRVLVQEGKLKEFLFDTYFATKENRMSTASLVSTEKEIQPQLAPTLFSVAPGKENLDEMVSHLKQGILISHWQLSDYQPSDAKKRHFLAQGWKTYEGKRAEPFSHVLVCVNILEVLKKVVSVGNDVCFVSHYASPSIALSNLPLE